MIYFSDNKLSKKINIQNLDVNVILLERERERERETQVYSSHNNVRKNSTIASEKGEKITPFFVTA